MCSSSQNFLERLIEEVENYPCLYNIRNQNYRNGTLKQQIWEKIAQILGTSGRYWYQIIML